MKKYISMSICLFFIACSGAKNTKPVKKTPKPIIQINFYIEAPKNAPKDKIFYVKNKKGQTVSLIKKAVLNNTDIKKASLMDGLSTRYALLLEFKEKGAKTFALVTGQNINSRMAIIIDKQVVSMPYIREKIPGGKVMIINPRWSEKKIKDILERLNKILK